jgi:type I restriction enzyme, R subunit
VLNASKPYGHIFDFRNQQANVDEAIAMFSGAKADQAREIWLVDKAPKVIEKLKTAVKSLSDFMKSQGLDGRPEAVANLKGDDARVAFVKQFKEVQRLQTQLDQYTDLTDAEQQTIEQVLPKDELKVSAANTLKPPSASVSSRGRPASTTAIKSPPTSTSSISSSSSSPLP